MAIARDQQSAPLDGGAGNVELPTHLKLDTRKKAPSSGWSASWHRSKPNRPLVHLMYTHVCVCRLTSRVVRLRVCRYTWVMIRSLKHSKVTIGYGL